MGNRYLEIFCREAEEHLASLQSGLLVLEKNPARTDLLHELLRNAHTLKGSARMVGLADISAITHTMEEQLKGMESGERKVDARGIDLLLRGADAVALITSALMRGEKPELDVERFVAEYDRGELGQQLHTEPRESQPEAALADTVRADVKTLDHLVNLVGELIINKKRLESKLDRLKEITGALPAGHVTELAAFRGELEEDVLYLDYLIQELHAKAMGLRMLPLRTISDGLERLVRDLAQQLGREVRFQIVGQAIEMDRVLLDGLKPILIHLLTNALSHGIESPEARAAAGKPRQGAVLLSARHQGNSVLVEVRDDGRGMDPAGIKTAAVARGVLDPREAEALSDDEALYLTFRPGFSTADIVTDVSGRGVGMDVVKKNIERVKGSVTLASVPGSFTQVTLQLPLTLSVLDALIVACGGETFAIPTTYLQEIVKVRASEIDTLGSGEVIKVRGATTPLYSLPGMLGLTDRREAGDLTLSAVVLKHCDQRIACIVDAHLGYSEVVVKGLGKQFRNVRFLFGATIMGDGNPALILNVPDLFESGRGVRRATLSAEEAQAAQRRLKVLVVDDSITTRTMEQSILVSQGYAVVTAVSGEDALEKSAQEQFDLVISDVEMPGINGFELTRALRASEQYRDIPVIIVSSLSRDEDKRQALQAGAQAYIVKGAFDQGLLLETVQMLIG
ncbi:hybrid sensor histidine kinase/response regulator [Geomonas subterranea]|uniref:Hybrid sensor histidine kinase/response regulator n=1 Tax=Geomonas subterranea TaxID=2847989 RepID=A0ABX8LN76_9BACT|nr:hybrid sensor histidine kinase/response regulator [Geomonas subterranea]QXE91779.1 hybrid sensor histidine kinase/response regulator [Geomonas subterranea]QXM10128.1 hybrid sensor histidine kinase/response regulator [Geomonas subterranea]